MTSAKPQKVIVGMSGGVDSSVAALLLKEQGYDVVGVMLKLWAEEGFARDNQCCSLESANQARLIAAKIGIPFYLLDAVNPFYKEVVEPFIADYFDGLTPNPCTLCNPLVRWRMLLHYADMVGAAYVATGHYVRITQDEAGRTRLYRGSDATKDQSYVISRLSQAQLSCSLFPLGNLRKTEVRRISRERELPSAEKPDSQDICFIGDGDYRSFLKRQQPERIQPGAILDEHGVTLGTHEGLPFYTIGQRKGLKIAAKAPLYVLAKDPLRNQLIVGSHDDFQADSVTVDRVNWVLGSPPQFPFNALAQFRYKSTPAAVAVDADAKGRLHIQLNAKKDAVACGQIAVIYSDQDEVIGSGRIIATGRTS